jgi:hypothetical protein
VLRCREADRVHVEPVLEAAKKEYAEKSKVNLPKIIIDGRVYLPPQRINDAGHGPSWFVLFSNGLLHRSRLPPLPIDCDLVTLTNRTTHFGHGRTCVAGEASCSRRRTARSSATTRWTPGWTSPSGKSFLRYAIAASASSFPAPLRAGLHGYCICVRYTHLKCPSLADQEEALRSLGVAITFLWTTIDYSSTF